ncbi:MAG: c-type cytochrome [Anaerolineae bacterium]
MMKTTGFCLGLMVVALLASCGPGAAPGPTATPEPPTPTPVDVSLVDEGYAQYVEAGCTACHGDNAEGGVGPGLPGHTREQVFAQVRNPRGAMPAFTDETVSDADLEKIAAYIVSLGPPTAGHVHGEFEATGSETSHLMLAFRALKSDNQPDAIHHLQHVLDIADDEGRAHFEAILADLEAGDLHDVEHEIEELLLEEQAELTPVQLHLQLALDSLSVDDVSDAAHHVDHALEVSEDASEQATLRELLDELAAGEIHHVEDHMMEIIGVEHHHD